MLNQKSKGRLQRCTNYLAVKLNHSKEKMSNLWAVSPSVHQEAFLPVLCPPAMFVCVQVSDRPL